MCATPFYQHRVDDNEQAVVAHTVEMVLHRREGREVLEQLRPLAPRRCDILDRIPQGPRLVFARASNPGGSPQ
jgi:hypothetical protein